MADPIKPEERGLSSPASAGDGGSRKLVGIFDMRPRSLTEAIEFSKLMAKSNLVPKEFLGDPPKILIAVQQGAELGLSPLQSLNSIAVINGKPTLWGDALLGIVKASGCLDSSFGEGGILERDPATAWKQKEGRCEVKRKDQANPTIRTFSFEDAERAGLVRRSQDQGKGAGPWVTYPGRMLQMRARSWALRDSCPDVLKGLRLREEVQDEVIDITGEAIVRPSRMSERAEVKAGEVDKFLASTGGSPEISRAPMRSSGGAPAAAPADPETYQTAKGQISQIEKTPTRNPNVSKFFITLKDGTKFQTISGDYAKVAKSLADTGEIAKISFEQNQFGKEIRGISAAVQPPPVSAPEEVTEEGDREPGSDG